MNLKTKYLGFELPHPFMPGASPLVDDLDTVKILEDAGASAIVMHSLFEEQVTQEQMGAVHHIDAHMESFGEATSFLPDPDHFALGPQDYLEQIRKVKECVSVPVIGSLNGFSRGGWTEYAELIEQAGADALELNIYSVATSLEESSQDAEDRIVNLARHVKQEVGIPVGVKISPYYTSLPHFVQRLEHAHLDGVILFNRFYQPDIDIQELEMSRTLRLSDSSELLTRLHGLAILSGRVNLSLAVTGGVHTGTDAIKAIMAGANAVQMVSCLLKNGPKHLSVVRQEMINWMEENEYESIGQMTGNMSLKKCPNPHALERMNYMEILQSWRRDMLAS